MKAAALIWLGCVAIYLDLLWRARNRGKFTGPFPSSMLAVIAGGLAWIAWGLVFGWPDLDLAGHLAAWTVAAGL